MASYDDYINYLNPGAFSGISGFYKNNKTRKKGLINDILKSEVYTLHKPLRKRFKRCKVFVTKIDEQWQCDLIDVKNIKGHNNNYSYIFTCIDSFSKYGWAIPILRKTSINCKNAFEHILNTSGRKPQHIYLDSGKEFLGEFKKLCDKHSIKIILTGSFFKASIVERFNRTLKEKLWRIFSHHKNLKRKFPNNYKNYIEKIVESYNKSYHRAIKTKPCLVTEKNEKLVFRNLYGDLDIVVKFGFKIGEYVRKYREKGIFSKGYEENWSREIFIIRSILPSNPPRYQIKNLEGKEIITKFYREELQKVYKDEFPYDSFKILNEKGDSLLVEKLNSDRNIKWIKKKLFMN